MPEPLRTVVASPEAMLFLTIVLGVLFGRQKLGGFSFGSAAGTLLVGTLVGALFGAAVPDLSPTLKSVAFLLFVFAVGFQSGPQFFASLGRKTLPLAIVTLVVAAVGLAGTVAVVRLFGLDQGTAIGLAAGALTQTAMLGTAYGALEGLGLPAAALNRIQGQAAVVFALTYIFGTIGVILFCTQIAPRLIGVDLKASARALDAGDDGAEPKAPLLDFRTLVARVFRVSAAEGMTIESLDAEIGPLAAVARIRRGGVDMEPHSQLVVRRGDLVAIQGYRPAMVAAAARIGDEVSADDLVIDLTGPGTEVVLASRFAGMTLRDAVAEVGEMGHGLFLRRIRRQAHDIPATATTVLMPGDVLTLAGPANRLAATAPLIGTLASQGNRADIAFLAAGLLSGVLIGLVSLTIKGIPVTLSAGGGALIAGLAFGWWHARRPAAAPVPPAATQIMWDFGLASFCALVGLTAGPQAASALGTAGLTILVAGVVVTLLPQLVGLYVGHYLLRIHPVLLVGALAGAQTQDAAMLAACDLAESPAPTLGFTVPYAIGNIVLTVLGPAIVALT
ncbi:TrkA C-terminal domain-containing protein [Phreatobacter stygius]|uniref:Transporter n=1 Tax=Phreatobacter stygius TaxID=1940610 RepID=A0A4D7BDH0_9HYPH|nr:TrkA C-terminal domain-containing protein [Phreatobacter stygius]QCI67406.1 transporter [Phreatobacter stygius]